MFLEFLTQILFVLKTQFDQFELLTGGYYRRKVIKIYLRKS